MFWLQVTGPSLFVQFYFVVLISTTYSNNPWSEGVKRSKSDHISPACFNVGYQVSPRVSCQLTSMGQDHTMIEGQICAYNIKKLSWGVRSEPHIPYTNLTEVLVNSTMFFFHVLFSQPNYYALAMYCMRVCRLDQALVFVGWPGHGTFQVECEHHLLWGKQKMLRGYPKTVVWRWYGFICNTVGRTMG